MTIAVHISLGDTPDDVRSEYNYHCFSRMAIEQPGDHFIFIFDKPFAPSLITSANITPVLLGPALKNRLLKHYWYQFKLPRLLSRYQADYYVNQDKMACLRTDTEQMLIVEDLAFIQRSGAYSGQDRRYLRKYFPGFIQKATVIGVMNKHLEEIMPQKFPSSAGKTASLMPIIEPVMHDTSESLPSINQLTEGRSYFVYLVTGQTKNHITAALKAFSIFKKWQKSNMQLLLVSYLPENELTIDSLSTYKYRDEIKLFFPKNRNERQHVLSGAYAALYLPSADIPEQASLESLSCGAPLICTDSPFQQARHKDGALYTDLTESAISEKMMRLYKDENLRSELVQSGQKLAAACGTGQAVSALRHALLGEKGLTFANQ